MKFGKRVCGNNCSRAEGKTLSISQKNAKYSNLICVLLLGPASVCMQQVGSNKLYTSVLRLAEVDFYTCSKYFIQT